MECVHLLSDEIVDIIPKVLLLHAMHEDQGVESRKRVEKFLSETVDRYFPGLFVQVTCGGDSFKPSCHTECWNYISDYGLYVVEASVWQQCQDMVLHVDQSFHTRQMRCQKLVG